LRVSSVVSLGCRVLDIVSAQVEPIYRGVKVSCWRATTNDPLPRTYGAKTIAATPPDRIETWSDPQTGVIVTAHVWLDVVLPDQPKDWDAETRQLVKETPWTIVLIFHPDFPHPLLLIMTLALSAPQAHAFYLDRWGIEHPPLVAKQTLGAARQFVFAAEARQRLPELSLLAGSVLSYVAACEVAIPTGFWDRHPKSTPGRLRRLLTKVRFPADFRLPDRLREKHSRTDHLPKGILAHRRTKQAVPQSVAVSPALGCQPVQT